MRHKALNVKRFGDVSADMVRLMATPGRYRRPYRHSREGGKPFGPTRIPRCLPMVTYGFPPSREWRLWVKHAHVPGSRMAPKLAFIQKQEPAPAKAGGQRGAL